MKKIVLFIKDVQVMDWSVVYQFIKGCTCHHLINNDILNRMMPFVDLAIDSRPYKCDVNSTDSLETFSLDKIINEHEISFVFITKPVNESELPINYVPLFVLQKKFFGIVSIGIDLINFLDIKKQENFTFRFSDFCLFIEGFEPLGGFHSLYFIHEIDSKKSSKQIHFFKNKVSSFKYKSHYNKPSWEKIIKKSSMKFYPLLQIDKNLFLHLFQNKVDNERSPIEIEYLKSSSEKIINQLKKVKSLSEQKYSSLFEKWFISAYFNTLSTIIDDKTYKELYPTLHSYYIGIYELVQNIIFHTEQQEGWIYIYFCKYDHLPSNVISKLSEYNVSFPTCFLRLGIYDFSPSGIIDTYNRKNNINIYNLADVVDPYILVSRNNQEDDYLCMTYASHLGIKTLVSSILSHYGLFRIETSHEGGKILIENKGCTLRQQIHTENVEGTHYDIILPIDNQENNTPPPYQLESQNSIFCSMLKNYKRIRSVCVRDLICSYPFKDITNRDYQDKVLSSIKHEIISLFNNISDKNYLRNYYALDMYDVKELTANLIFRIIVTLRMGDSSTGAIVLFNLNDDIIDDICNIVKIIGERKNKKNQPIWSNEHAVILMNQSFRIQILCGESTKEISSLNAWFECRYNGFRNVFSKWKIENGSTLENDNRFLLPYECMIYNNEKPLFLDVVSTFLDKKINTNSDYGFLVDRVYTKIGSKMYVEKFYDAYTLFLNSFFVDRLAFFIANDIINNIDDILLQKKNIVLIGYRSFSDLTMRKIQSYVNDFSFNDKRFKRKVIQEILIAEEGEKENGLFFRDIEEKNNVQFNDSYFVLVVPVASTLSTHDKMVTYFKKKTKIQTELLFLNYCAVLVRDKELPSISFHEKEWRWSNMNHSCIETGLLGAGRVKYLISKSSEWHDLIDKNTFPSSITEEKYLNRTGDASLNLWNMFGYPTVSLPSKDLLESEVKYFGSIKDVDSLEVLKDFFEINNKRIKEFSPYIHVGHLYCGHNHHRYYFDTERYISQADHQELTNWMGYLRNKEVLWKDHSKVPVIIVPEYSKESIFINLVNEKLFDNNAFIVIIDVSNSIDIVKSSYSFLSQKSESFSFFFIDHAILTAETYEKTRICLSAILNKPDFNFESILVLINRLSEMKFKSISGNLKGGYINSFIHFFIPPSKDMGEDCSLCGLEKHYEDLLNFTVVEACRRVVKDNKDKFYLEKNYKNGIVVGSSIRAIKRMEIRNNLFFMITCIQNNIPIGFLFKDKKDRVEFNGESIDEKVDKALNLYYENLQDDIDYQISFFKAISFPPLSQYVYIRRFAHQLAINELKRVLSKSNPDYEDFCILKTLLKHLSWLSSNAIIRKEVIISSWKLYFMVANKILMKLLEIREEIAKFINYPSNDIFLSDKYKEENILKDQFSKTEGFGNYYQFCIRNATYVDEAKSFYLGELLRTGDEINTNLPLKSSETILYNCLFKIMKRIKMPDYSIFHEKKGIIHDPFRIFLSNIYYDNTTIFRKTLENFDNEISKDEELLRLFYVDSRQKKLHNFDVFDKSISRISERMLDIVNKQYYYYWFRLLLIKNNFHSGNLDATRDGVPLIRKLIYVLYAQKAIDQFNSSEHSFENDVRELLQICSAIMDTCYSFITIKYKEKLYTLVNNQTTIKFKNLEKELSCGKFLFMDKKNVRYPFIIKDNHICDHERQGINNLTFNRLCCQLLSIDEPKCDSYVSAVTYLYNDTDIKFHIKKMECSRILLLLKPKIDKYVSHCYKERLFPLWFKHMNTINQFKKINLLSNHRLRLDGWDFEKLDLGNYKKIDRDLFMLSNVVISHLFSILTVEHEIKIKSVTKKIDEIFSDKFLALLSELNNNRWGKKLKITKKDEDGLPLTENSLIIQSFVIQCIENAHTKLTKKNSSKDFAVDLIIGKNSIEIKNNFPGIGIDEILKEKEKFDNLYKEDTIRKNLDLEQMSDYGMTLSSLLIYANTDTLKCRCGFSLEGEPTFRVKLFSSYCY